MPGIAVGLGSSARVIAMDHALKAAALGASGHLDELAGSENPHRHFGSRLGSGGLSQQVEAPEHPGSDRQAGLGGMSQLGLPGPRASPGAEAELDLPIPHLHHRAGPRLDDRDRDGRAVVGEDPGHSELAADEPVGHSLTAP